MSVHLGLLPTVLNVDSNSLVLSEHMLMSKCVCNIIQLVLNSITLYSCFALWFNYCQRLRQMHA